MRALRTIAAGMCLALAGAFPFAPPALAQQSQGLTVPQVLPPFEPGGAACSVPTGLNKSIGFAQDNERDFIAGVGVGLAAAAKDRGLSFSARTADNDPARQAAD